MKEVKRKYAIAMFMVIVALMLAMAVRVEKASASIPITAYKTGVAYYQWGLPHYGAFYGLIDCNSQWYTGANPHGSYGSFDWWGNHHNVLLLDKTWYLWYSAPKVASNHHAQCNS